MYEYNLIVERPKEEKELVQQRDDLRDVYPKKFSQ
jgi:hypothetical protein